MDPASPASEGVIPAPRPVRWGLGDVVWIYFAGLVLSVVGTTVGLALSGDTSGHFGALTIGLGALGQFGGWFAGCAYVAHAKGGGLRRDFGFTVRISEWWALFAGLGVYLLGTVLIYPLVSMVNEHQQVVQDLEQATGAKLAVFVALASVIAPVCEELLFRGLLLRALRRRMSPVAAIAIQALAFGLVHPLLSPTLGDFAVVPALVLLGTISGVAAERRGDLSASILMHIGFNLVTTLTVL